jgi:hypothetical protein
MKAIIERADLNGSRRWVESPTIFTSEDEANYGPIAYNLRGNAHVFESFAKAGAWVDENERYGVFAVHAVKVTK